MQSVNKRLISKIRGEIEVLKWLEEIAKRLDWESEAIKKL